MSTTAKEIAQELERDERLIQWNTARKIQELFGDE